MILTIDIGNTNITMGVFAGELLQARWRFSTDIHRLPDEYALQLQGLFSLKQVPVEKLDAVAICSVVPPLTSALQEAVRTLLDIEPFTVGSGTRTGIRVLYDSPKDVGSDRIVDAAAAYFYYGAPAIVVDFGTATVFDAIAKDGSYLGGAISPGLTISLESLFTSTSQLRRIELAAPTSAIGKNTVHSMQSGLVLGYVGLVETMINRFKNEMADPDIKVIATGGSASLIVEHTDSIDVIDEDLTLRGLRYIHSLNSFSTENKQ
jgi:type III pantothenate kinase